MLYKSNTTTMWNYKITKTELGWIIYRKYEKG
jgi:hypothetical protein